MLIDYSDLRRSAMDRALEKSATGDDIFEICKDKWKELGFVYIFMCLGEKESRAEFCELFYEIILYHYFKSHLDFTARCIDMCFLYIFYSAQDDPKIKISLNTILLDNILSSLGAELACTKNLLRLLIGQNAFTLSYLVGLKTRILNNKGETMKLLAEDSDCCDLLFKTNELMVCDEELLNLKKIKARYLEHKKYFIREFVEKDQNELISYDEDTGLVGRKVQEQLGSVTNLSLDFDKFATSKL